MPKAQKVFSPILNFIFNLYTKFATRKFGKIGKGVSIRPVLNSHGEKNITLGDDISLGLFCWLGTNNSLKKNPRLTIGNRVHIGAYAMIIAADEITIGNNVLMSERVTIVDHLHDYRDAQKAVIDQPIFSEGKIEIGDDCFVGVGAVIMGGVKIGKHAVIGANAVVTKDVPPFSVAVGSPAKVIKTYDFNKKKWIVNMPYEK